MNAASVEFARERRRHERDEIEATRREAARLSQIHDLAALLDERAMRLILAANDLRLRVRGRKLRPAARADLIERMELRAERLEHHAVAMRDEEPECAEQAYREFQEEFHYGM